MIEVLFFSGPVLIGRGFEERRFMVLFKNEVIHINKYMCILLGHYSGGGTPVPIPNTELSPPAPMVLPGYPGGRVGRGQVQST